jgi:ferrous iron transport protein A
MSPAVSHKRCVDCPEQAEAECRADKAMTLCDYKPGQKGKIRQVCGEPTFRLRMMEMGFIRGTEIQVVKYAPLSDPMEFVIKGYHITLRKEQAADILMFQPEKAA